MAPQLNFDHLGLVCAELALGRSFLSRTISVRDWTQAVTDPIQKVHVQFGRDSGGMVYELIAPTADDSPIAASLRAGQNILNHMAYRTRDINAAAAHLLDGDCIAVSMPNPAVAFNGALIQFFYSPLNFIIELIEQDRSGHNFTPLAGDQ
ncbi:VOC family protein [Falsihalocynthiibacter sp. S25ZX9]|uniref:VOC family protein n=1 Tax=Falsihalocynthiibacter sp. S25ZX9 TaxID=3240870 RepID=UPI00350FEF00